MSTSDTQFYRSLEQICLLLFFATALYTEKVQGLRLAVKPMIFGIMVYSLVTWVIEDVTTQMLTAFQATFVVLSLVIIVLFGKPNLFNYKVSGPYQVGYKVIHTTINQNRVSVYYPIDHHEYN